MFENREHKSVMLGIKLTPKERRVLEQHAKDAGLTLSEFGRLAIGDAIRRRIEEDGVQSDDYNTQS